MFSVPEIGPVTPGANQIAHIGGSFNVAMRD